MEVARVEYALLCSIMLYMLSREGVFFFLTHENLECVHCLLEGDREVKIWEIRNNGHVEVPEISGAHAGREPGWGQGT